MAERAPPHAARSLAMRQMVIGAVLVAYGAAMVGTAPPFGLCVAAVGLVFARQGLALWRVGPAVMLANKSFGLISQERYDEAAATLDAIPAGGMTPLVQKAIAAQRAHLALARGDFTGALAVIDGARRIPRSWMWRAQERDFDQRLRGVRALALAATGDLDGARVELTALTTSRASAEVLALASLVRAVVAARAKDHEGLAAALIEAHDREEHLGGRLRALLRALSRMAAATRGSVYRMPGRSALHEPLSPVGEWVRALVPDAAEHAPRALARPPLDAARPAPQHAAQQVDDARRRAAKGAPKTGPLAALAVLTPFAAAVAWLLLRGQIPTTWDLLGAAAASLCAWIAWMFLWARRQRAQLQDVSVLRGEGRHDDADALLARLAKARSEMVSASAMVLEAEALERAGDFDAALRRCELGVGRVLSRPQVQAAASDLLLPTLMATRARMLALLDRGDEALAELERLAKDHPAYPFAAAAGLSVRLILAVREGDEEAARRLALARTADLSLSRRVEHLADMVLARDGVWEADGDLARILAELDADATLRGWITRVAPGLEEALRGPVTGVRVEGGDLVAEALDAAHVEAAAAASRKAG